MGTWTDRLRDAQVVASRHHSPNLIEQLNQSTHALAENMMNSAVRGALKGTKID